MKPHPTPSIPLIWGHRGAMAFAPQNTLPSFQLAVEQGADGVELDVQLTADGVPVVFHDARVDDLTPGHGPLKAMPWSVVQALDAGSHFGPGWAHARIPTLEEVLENLPASLVINVELKTDLSESTRWDRWRTLALGPKKLTDRHRDVARAEAEPLAEAVARLLEGQPQGRILVSSFDPWALEAFGARLPEVPLGFLHAPSVPWDTPRVASQLNWQAWHPHHSQVTPEAVARAHSAGRKVHVWTVNEAKTAHRCAEAGVDALITNRPGPLREELSRLKGPG